MLVLGILSIFQIVNLPGLLILKLFKIKTTGFIQTFLYSFGLSLTFNYYFIIILVLLKIYIAATIVIFFILELLLYFFFIIKGKIKIPFNRNIRSYFVNFIDYINRIYQLHRILFLSSCLFLLFFISTMYFNSSTVYYFYDAIARKPWIETWASNHFFTFAHYLQFLPINFSLISIFTQDLSIELFSKAIMPLFYIGILLIFLDLYLQKRQIIYLTSFLIYSFILLVFYGILFISDFNYDIPVSFYGFLAFYVILKQDRPGFDIKTVLLTSIFSFSAANIKMAGMFVVGLFSLWFLYYIYVNRKQILKSDLFKTFIYLIPIFISGLFWYVLMQSDMTEYAGQSPFNPNDGLYTSLMYGLKLLYYGFGPVFSIFLLITLVSAFFTEFKYIMLLTIVPLFFVWAFWYSYDCRNLSMAIPFAALSSAYGLKFIWGKLKKYLIQQNSNEKATLKLTLFSIKEKSWPFSILFITILIAAFILVNSNFFFNLIISLSYFLWKFYFQLNTVVFTTELGYYKYVVYYVAALKVSIILLLLLYILRLSKIKIVYVGIFISVCIFFLNFTYLKRENILNIQSIDSKMINVHNLYFEIYPYMSKSQLEIPILTNSSLVNKLIFKKRI